MKKTTFQKNIQSCFARNFVTACAFISTFSIADHFLVWTLLLSETTLSIPCLVRVLNPFTMPSAAELITAADTLASSSLYAEAITTYTKAIELAPTAPLYYIKR